MVYAYVLFQGYQSKWLCNSTQTWKRAMMNYCRTLRRFVKNLRSSKEGWVPAANLLSLISESKSSQSLSSSGIFPIASPLCLLSAIERPAFHACPADGSVSGNVSTSSSCSETYTSYSDIKPWPTVAPAPPLEPYSSTTWNSPSPPQTPPQTKALVRSLFLVLAVFTRSAVLYLKRFDLHKLG